MSFRLSESVMNQLQLLSSAPTSIPTPNVDLKIDGPPSDGPAYKNIKDHYKAFLHFLRMSGSAHPFTLSKEQIKRKLRVGVAIDGSGVSEKAFLLGGRLLHTDRHDKLYILHVSDPNKPWLPDTLTPEHLEHEYQLKSHDQQVCMAESKQTVYRPVLTFKVHCSLMRSGTRRKRTRDKAPARL